MNDYVSYGYLVNFAQYAFTFFNGKVNNIFPARMLLIDNSINKSQFGQTNGSIVVLYPNNIINYFNKNPKECTERKVKGLVMYTIIHELSHLDQDYNIYYNLGTTDIKIIDQIIEKSNDAMTYTVLDSILSNEALVNEYRFDFEIMNFYRYNEEEFKMYYNSYYKLNNPLDKALFYLKTFLTPDYTKDIMTLLTENYYTTVFLELNDIERNHQLCGFPVIFNNTICNSSFIMDLCDNVLLGAINNLYDNCAHQILINDKTKTKIIIFNIKTNKIIPISISNQIIPTIPLYEE